MRIPIIKKLPKLIQRINFSLAQPKKISSWIPSIPFIPNIKSAISQLDAYQGTDWKPFASDEEKRMLIYRNTNFDIIIRSWPAKSSIGFHDHPINGCIFKMLEGSLEESILYASSDLVSNSTVKVEDGVKYISNDIGYHSIRNPSENRSVSLHIYCPGYYIPKFF
uniref:Cysteine dioxygenase type I n=1 Tax=Iridovirus LCIVAC01 TaxID=2506607 RepID=A0A481YPZ6_9VIRU|nr:MAG: cysteine dioxygenase type I [Iridovirus LCIVAC01]